MEDPSFYFSVLPSLLSVFNPLTIGVAFSFLVLAILLLLSAMISGSEVAFFSLSPSEKELINTAESKSHTIAQTLLNSPKKLLATILISNNFINVGIIILSTFTIDNVIDLERVPTWVNFFIQIIGITFVLLLFGEVIPKVYATKNALKMTLMMAYPLSFLKTVFSPLSMLLVHSTRIIDKRIKKKSLDVSVEELSYALDLTGDIPENEDEHKILKGIVKFGEISVKQIMKARVDVVAIDKNTSYKDVMSIILDSGHSRIPVYEESFDKIIGLLYVKDLLKHLQKDTYPWQKLCRTPFFVPENKKLDDLLKEFQEKKVHMAIVVDEYGGTSGIVTLEDVLEEIVGEISDEFDLEDISYSKLDDNTYIFEGKTALNDVARILNIENDDVFGKISKEAESLGGLIIEIAGKIPQKNEKIVHDNFTFIIEASDKRKIKRVKLIQKKVEELI